MTSITAQNFDTSDGNPDYQPPHEVVGFAEPVVLTVHFNNSVVVEGFPRIRLTVGTQERYAELDRARLFDNPDTAELVASGGKTLYFNYWVEAGDYDMDGVEIVADAGIILNGGKITTGGYTSTLPHRILTEGPANLSLDDATIDIAAHSGGPLKVNGAARRRQGVRYDK